MDMVGHVVHMSGHPTPQLNSEFYVKQARAQELELENLCLTKGLLVYSAERVPQDGNPWTFLLSASVDAEQHAFASTPIGSRTKMSLARQLQLRDDDDLKKCFRNFVDLNKVVKHCKHVSTPHCLHTS
jgi:hypothetical protein